MRPSIAIVLPAYGEGRGITPTLESLWHGMKALGISGAPVFLSDSSPDSATVDAATTWANTSGASLVIDHSDVRRSLKAALNVALAWCRSDLMLVTVADVIVPTDSLASLLGTLLADPRPAIAVGVAKPDPTARGLCYKAGAFQLRTVAREVDLRPPEMRAEGALWGAWRSFYEELRFPEGVGSIADDVELAKAVAARGVRAVTSKGALVYKIPAGTLRDFCLQTRRFYYATAGMRTRRRDWLSYGALVQEAACDPIGALCYAAYRLYGAAFASRFAAAAHSETWDPSPSTKRAGERN
ncbi:MAG: glycosyltransferase family A protein [Actinomycetota bacterium]|nr:glycosyltransferase family A protein [Actinomycetota bacterium]